MTDTAPAVALLFDDTELGSQLREALHERGARIVHEGGVASLSRELLQQVGADVLVVNLDDSADDALDRLYEVIDDDCPRVVFNDAQASRALAGWDRARWARHLAVKVLAEGDIDPPRPGDAPGIEVAATAQPPAPAAEVVAMAAPVMTAPAAQPVVEPVVAVDAEPVAGVPAHDGADGRHGQVASVESESLAAELEALLASGELPPDDDMSAGPGLRFVDDEEPPSLHDGNFGAPAGSPAAVPTAEAPVLSGLTPSAFQLDSLPSSSLTDVALATAPASPAAASPVRAPAGWTLVDDEAPQAAPEAPESPDAQVFGIQKLSAADFLAPDVEMVAADVEPRMSLELVSMEEAIAPQAYVHEHEMVLDDLDGALSRVVLLGAAIDGIDAVCAFLAALPASTGQTFLLTQHLGRQSDASLVAEFSANCALPVRLAKGGRTRPGEVLLVPAGQQVRLRRDGIVELQANGADAPPEPSIDASLTMAANAFGRDALAIVFAGRGNDAVAGAQAIHDRGGQVWVESSSGEHFADMVSGILAERLVSFSGTPPELAAHLIEVFP
ncbi:chemotaxis protein CheB [Rhodanobacter thiooxydans]|uniref:protein-glutamate methylesterase n=1 Tax=Rhodanobacter thiooxydans TaxID=416169 RepID=A0A154QMA4_9GAMM|nr:chemotaxis protein CheB [Rhodanobacter thiooxydans]EIL99724.1 protein-glutamate methylesterase [Rhodanobacter thiooxydans LCS2]KZC25319.1 chemotaxis protein CheB [Rhodanobacter thiooxydans]MCW0202364.1 chemotaxis protein CheB [Rhodanobacter thiooxydans]